MPWGPWLQLNWENSYWGTQCWQQPGVRNCNSKALEKLFAEWRVSLIKSFPTEWQRKKCSNVRSVDILWTLSRLSRTIPRPVFPPTVLSARTHPPRLHFLHVSPHPHRLCVAPVFCPQQGQSHLMSHTGWWKPTWTGEKGQGQGCRQHLDEKRKLQNVGLEQQIEHSSDAGVFSFKVSALMERCSTFFFVWDQQLANIELLREYTMLLWRKPICWPNWNTCFYLGER